MSPATLRLFSSPLEDMPTSETPRRPSFDDLPEFLSPEEFRQHVRISRSTMYDLLRRDEVPHLRFGRTIRIPKSVLASLRRGVE